MKTRREHLEEMRNRDRFVCPICRRRMSKKEFWDVGYIRTKWMGDRRYDDEKGVFVHDGDIHPCIEEKWVCQDCFEAVMKAIRERRDMYRNIDIARIPQTCSHMTKSMHCTIYDVSMRCCYDPCLSCEHFDGEREER